MQRDFEDIRNGVVLAELGGYGDGPYCAKHGAGSALVVLGTYIVDPGDSVPYPEHFVFKPGRSNYAGYLREHVAAARAGGAKVGVSVISVDIPDTVDFLKAAEDAGADYVSLCAHSTMDMFLSANVGSALCYRENWDLMREWATAILEAVQVPLIFKIRAYVSPDSVGAVEVIVDAGVPIVHANVGDTSVGAEGLTIVRNLKGKRRFLIAGGGVKDIEGAQRLLETGADAVAIGTAAMNDASFCSRVQKLLRE